MDAIAKKNCMICFTYNNKAEGETQINKQAEYLKLRDAASNNALMGIKAYLNEWQKGKEGLDVLLIAQRHAELLSNSCINCDYTKPLIAENWTTFWNDLVDKEEKRGGNISDYYEFE